MNQEFPLHGSDHLIVVDGARRKRGLIIVVVAVVALLIGGLAYWAKSRSAADKDAAAASAEAGQVPTVTVVVTGQSAVPRTITASGALAARRDQPVGIAGAGGRVTSVRVDAGSWVRAGQVLATVERSVQTELAAQQGAQIAAARANAALAQNNYDRALSLMSRGFVSKADMDAKHAARDAASAQVRVQQAQLGQTRAQIGQLDVRAPTSGLVLARSVEVGQVVSAGAGGLFRLAAGGEMEMRASLSQQDLATIRPGMAATVTPTGSPRSYAGNVWQVSPVIDPVSRQGDVRIAVPYDPSIRPGGFAEAKINAGTTTAPLLPQSAVLSDEKGNYVYLVGRDHKVERRAITIGTVTDTGVIIASGLTGQEAVVLSAGPFLNPGQKVLPQRQAAARVR